VDSRASVNLGVKVFGPRSAATLECAGLVDSVRFTYTMMCETLDPQLFRSGYVLPSVDFLWSKPDISGLSGVNTTFHKEI
jgi:hypothetical protein